jgi:hypothetical protein
MKEKCDTNFENSGWGTIKFLFAKQFVKLIILIAIIIFSVLLYNQQGILEKILKTVTEINK